MKKILPLIAVMFISAVSFSGAQVTGFGEAPSLPRPFETQPAKRYSKIIGWQEGLAPRAPVGFTVTPFALQIKTPRWIYELPNGDVLVAQSRSGANSPDKIVRLRDEDHDGMAEKRDVFLQGLNQPLGMALVGDNFYVANTDGLMRYPYSVAGLGTGMKVLDLPAGGYNNHWTRNILPSRDGKKLYISVGSGSNVGEDGMQHEVRRACILVANIDGSGERVLASGLRNPVGMDFEPVTGKLWTAVNERDNLGDDLVPDYFTSVLEGGFYGWPYYYFGKNPDPRWDIGKPESDLVVTRPDYALGAHTASLGLAFYTGKTFPEQYHGGAFIGQHGSWNRSTFTGYKVIFVPFKKGKPAGPPEDFLTGFMKDAENGDTYGRPVGVTMLKDGSLLVADDAGGAIWRVAVKGSVQ